MRICTHFALKLFSSSCFYAPGARRPAQTWPVPQRCRSSCGFSISPKGALIGDDGEATAFADFQTERGLETKTSGCASAQQIPLLFKDLPADYVGECLHIFTQKRELLTNQRFVFLETTLRCSPPLSICSSRSR